MGPAGRPGALARLAVAVPLAVVLLTAPAIAAQAVDDPTSGVKVPTPITLPDTPKLPDAPGLPDVPSVSRPDTPDTPGAPDTPDTPDTPDVPDADTPGDVDAPADPGTVVSVPGQNDGESPTPGTGGDVGTGSTGSTGTDRVDDAVRGRQTTDPSTRHGSAPVTEIGLTAGDTADGDENPPGALTGTVSEKMVKAVARMGWKLNTFLLLSTLAWCAWQYPNLRRWLAARRAAKADPTADSTGSDPAGRPAAVVEVPLPRREPVADHRHPVV